MRRVAANKVFFSPSKSYTRHIIEIQGQRIVNHYHLHDELELTEWLGGIIIITKHNNIIRFIDAYRQNKFVPDNIQALLQYIYSHNSESTNNETSHNTSALHIVGVDLSTGKIIDKITISPIYEDAD